MLITITLLAFLVLLLVSLASLTRVETQVAANTQQTGQARENALLALHVAIGQLQKYAGPDQRTTARADIDASLVNDPVKNGRWLGVYGSRVPANYAHTPEQIADGIAAAYAAAGTDPLAVKGSHAILLNWLVSGNEHTAFAPLADVALDGHISRVTPPTPAHAPSDERDLDEATALPSDTDVSTILVGKNSVTLESGGTTIAESDIVTAPLVPITVPENTLPGFDPASSQAATIGRYAWWVGDEGAKAHVNLAPDPSIAQLPPADPQLAFVSARRTAIELIDKINPVGSAEPFDTGDLVGSAYAPTGTAINNLLSSQQLSSLDLSVWDSARKLRFHDLTATSSTLLADTYAGGLKKDLSAVLSTTGSTYAGHDDADFLFPLGAGYPANNWRPTWGRLRSFVQTTQSDTVSDPLIPRFLTGTTAQIAPVMTFAELGLEYYQTATGAIRLALFPRVVLWNPYTRPLAPARYEFGFTSDGSRFQLQSSTDDGSTWTPKEDLRTLSQGGRATNPLGASGHAFIRFIVDAQAAIPPGESRVYVIAPSGAPAAYDLSNYASPPTITLDANTFLPGYAYIETGQTASPTEQFRVPDGTTDGVFRANMTAYLGIAPSSPDYSETAPNGRSWPGSNRRWYQTIAYIGPSGNPVFPSGLQSANTLPTTPGLSPWGIQTRLSLANSSRYLAINNPRGTMGVIIFNGYRFASSAQGTHIGAAFNPDESDTRASSGLNLDALPSNKTVDSILFEFRSANQPLLSIGWLQHADLFARADIPAYAIGNSLAPYLHLNTDKTNRDRLYRSYGGTNPASAVWLGGMHDASYLLNRSLWDRYFVSTVPHTGTAAATAPASIPTVLPNARHAWSPSAAALSDAQKRDGATVAAHLTLKGGFNINSTSEQAWRAVLGGLRDLSHHLSGSHDDAPDALGTAFPRFANPPDSVQPVAGDPSWAFRGYRRLSDAQIAALATRVVHEVRARGPFVSLADFVNRRLRDNPATASVIDAPNSNESVQGALQNAIDHTAVSGADSVNNSRALAPLSTTFNINGGGEVDVESQRGGVTTGNATHAPFGSPASNSPQFLTQADILSAIGPGLAARSDTFTVRTYGDVRNPATGEITARAWCEAVVQRTAEPVNRRSSAPANPDYHEPATATATTPDFGRRFKTISFRWISPNDI